ncbi:hypothetical protein BDQ17DRAFT_1327081 [Cyathus striatus]|nr:hypothetical protein BDQ17DRAFT_1327081 [Cyathus striatus]
MRLDSGALHEGLGRGERRCAKEGSSSSGVGGEVPWKCRMKVESIRLRHGRLLRIQSVAREALYGGGDWGLTWTVDVGEAQTLISPLGQLLGTGPWRYRWRLPVTSSSDPGVHFAKDWGGEEERESIDAQGISRFAAARSARSILERRDECSQRPCSRNEGRVPHCRQMQGDEELGHGGTT